MSEFDGCGMLIVTDVLYVMAHLDVALSFYNFALSYYEINFDRCLFYLKRNSC